MTDYFLSHPEAQILKVHWQEFGKKTKQQAYQAAARWCQTAGSFTQKMQKGDEHLYIVRIEPGETSPSREPGDGEFDTVTAT